MSSQLNTEESSGNALVQARTPAALSSAPVLRSSLTPDQGPGQDTFPIGEYLGALRRYAWLLAVSVLATVGMAAYRLSQEPARYLATTSLRMVERSLGMSGDLANAGQSGSQQGWSYIDPMLSQIQVLRSRAVAGMAVDSLGLRLRPVSHEFPYAGVERVLVAPEARSGDTVQVDFGPESFRLRSGTRTALAPYGTAASAGGVTLQLARAPQGWTQARFALLDREDAIDGVLGSLQANPREGTDVVDLGFTANDPALATRAADGVAQAFLRMNAQSAKQEARLRRTYIQEQLRTTDSLLLRAQYELSSFRQRVRSFSPRDKFRAAEEGIGQMRIQREAVAAEQRLFAQMLNNLRASSRAGAEEVAALAATPQIASNGGIVSIYEHLVHYQTSRDSITTGPWSRAGTNPDVIRLDSLISTYRNRLVRAVEARSASLTAQLAVIDQVISSDAATLQGLPDAESEEVRLSRQVETLQTLADDLLREQQKARIDEAVRQGTVEIVDAARGGIQVGRGSARRLSFALLLGLMLGGAGALALDRLNNSVRRREDVEQLLHVPILAVVPRVGGLARQTLRFLPMAGRAARAPRGDASELITISDLNSAGSQAYRKLRTHLIFSHPGAPLRTLLVTSPAASEGKSTVSANLAVAYAQQRLRVVLVDADLRRARLHNIFGRERLPGLAEVVVGQATLDQALRETETPGLSLLPAGTLVPNVSELLGTTAMQGVLRQLSEQFDLVIVDTPPVLAAADAEILGVQTDAVLLVVRAGQTDRHSAQHAVQQLRAVGARIVGAVLNDPDAKIAGYGRYGYYYSYYADSKD
jgi:polysaccharide biosynthesis transport protein